MEREYSNYHLKQDPPLKLVPLRQPFDQIRIDTFYPEESGPEPKKHLTYTLEYDVDAYQKIQIFKDTDTLRYQQEKDALDGLTRFNQITMLGERLNAGMSARRDVMGVDGIMRDAFKNRPLIDWYEKGRQRSRELGSSRHDQLREAAEIDGQKKIQSGLSEIGSMMVSVSPPGGDDSIYKHNFYDIFHRISVSEIEVVRYMSGLGISETLDRLQDLGIKVPQGEVDDVSLLANPFEIDLGRGIEFMPDDIHGFLHSYMENSLNREEMEIVKQECMPFINRYLLVVENAPFVTEILKKSYNAILNHADNVVAQLKNGTYSSVDKDSSAPIAPMVGVLALGSQSVRSVDTGCGFSGGFSVSNGSPFGVLDFASGFHRTDEKDNFGSLYFNCPHCNFENKRPSGILIPKCQNERCKRDVSCGPDQQAEKKKKEKLRQEEEQREQKRLEEASVLEKKKKEKQKKKDEEGGFLLFLFQPKEEKEAA